MLMTEEMISKVAVQVLGTEEVTFGQHQISLKAPFARLSLREAAREAAARALAREVTDADLRDRDRAARSMGWPATRSWPREMGREAINQAGISSSKRSG